MEILDYYREIQLEANKDAYRVTFYYLTIQEGIPNPHGAGVFIKIGDTKFALTAAHVIENSEDDIYIGIQNNTVLKLGGESTTNKAPGSRDDDKIDIAIMKLSQETIEEIRDSYEYLDFQEIEINHEFKLLPMYQSVGYCKSRTS